MKKTFIVSCYFKKNFGSALQAYATQYFLDENGIDNETINVSCLKDFSKGKKKYYRSQIFNFSFYKAKFGMIRLLFKKRINKKLKSGFRLRNKEFLKFQNRYFRLTKPLKKYSELSKLCEEEACNVVVGSDQLWLPVNVVADYYTLNFVPNNINKVSYATSLGISSLPKKYESRYTNFLNRFNKLSVRELSGKKIVESLTNKECKVVCDPTFLLTKQDWDKIIDDGRFVEEKYIFCYFLGKTKEHRQFAENIRKLTGYKIVSINHCDEFVKYDDKYSDFAPYNVGPSEWLNLIKNAEFVCTDSFHGTVFSLLFNKQFFSFRRFAKKTSFSTNSRLDTLLGVVGLQNRIFLGNESIDEISSLIANIIDYGEVDLKINSYVTSSKQFFLDALTKDSFVKQKGISIYSKQMCSGCSACKSICPKDAIEMVADEEGFLYPRVNQNKCIDCRLCINTCPILNLKKESKKEQKAFLIRNLDENVLLESTSGGCFSALAECVLKQNGVVFGASFDENYKVRHKYIENIDELKQFRNSKYVQSDLKDTFIEVKKYLIDKRIVLYSGTPCQIEGLKAYLLHSRVNIDNLYLVDLVCHSVPSPLVWEKYKEIKGQDGCMPHSFRNKEKYGYEYSQMCLQKGDKKLYVGVESDPYFRAFLSDLSIRPACVACKFKKRYRESDLTLWDCFTIHKFDKSLDDNKGVTRCLTHSQKGLLLIDKIKDNCLIKEIEPDKAVCDAKELVRSANWNINREQFFKDVNGMESNQLFKKWFPINVKVRTMKFIRVSLEKLGIYRPVKRFAKRIIGK